MSLEFLGQLRTEELVMPEGIPGHSCSPEVVLGHHRNSQYVPVFTSQVQYVLFVEVVLKTSSDIPRCPKVFLDYLDVGQVIVRAWDITGFLEMSQALVITCPRSK